MPGNFWKGKNVLVTGGTGFIGSHLVDQLVASGAAVTVTALERTSLPPYTQALLQAGKVSLVTGDLRTSAACDRVAKGQAAVFHLASQISGVAYNIEHPGSMLRDNILMSTNMLEAARKADVDRFLMISSACVYPRFPNIPTPETDGFVDMPEASNFGYGWSKRIGELLATTYHQEYGMNISVVRPYNTYGPRDHFSDAKAHVIPALIRRIGAGESPLVVWGDGSQSRSFLYVDDNVRGLMLALERYPVPDPLNLGTEEEVTIGNLVRMLLAAFGVSREIIFDTNKPAGQPRRACDVRKARERIGFTAAIPLAVGLQRTVDWYQQHP